MDGYVVKLEGVHWYCCEVRCFDWECLSVGRGLVDVLMKSEAAGSRKTRLITRSTYGEAWSFGGTFLTTTFEFEQVLAC